MDFFSNGLLNRPNVEAATDGFALELCFEAAIASDDDSDSDCDWDEDDWIMRKRRCGGEETEEYDFWNTRDDRRLMHHEGHHEEGGLFSMLDADQDGMLSIFEFYLPFGEADKNLDYMIDPEEMMEWLMDNEYTLCAPFEDVIDELIHRLNDEFDSEEEFAEIFM